MVTPLEPWIEARTGAPPTPVALARYQGNRLRATVDWAGRRSPFYREHLAGTMTLETAGILPWTKVPFTTAADLIRHGDRFFCGSLDDIERVVTLFSSGTTAPPKRIYFTREDLGHTLDFFSVGMAGIVSPGDRVLILLPGDRPDSVGDLLKRGLARIGCDGVPHGPVRDPVETLSVIGAQGIDALVGIPVQVLSLVRAEAGICGAGTRVRKVLLTTDHVPRAIKQAVESAWPCRVFNHYGMTEMGLGGGVECAAREGYHLREADLYIEIVDTETGAVLSEGATGEIVFTTLIRRGMPLIRYRTGDLGRFLTEPCPCGSILRRLARVRSRVDGRIALGPTQGLTLADLDEAVFPIPWVVNFQAVLTGDAGMAILELACRVTSRAPKGAEDAVRTAVGRIAAVDATVGAGCLQIAVTCADVLGLPVSTGAGKRVLTDSRKMQPEAEG
ncbi:DVU_1553 family AMP-dependent CoA ligase [Desulfococcus sp.]|uniref:DVU_1553 family AMP-dependent CoA ligase n=1 Tax=Desulfococcus sp. TaxID=2025834 RepID=UPI003593C536